MRKWTDEGHIPNTWWNRNKGKVLFGVALTATAIAASQIYARKQDWQYIEEQGLKEDHIRWINQD